MALDLSSASLQGVEGPRHHSQHLASCLGSHETHSLWECRRLSGEPPPPRRAGVTVGASICVSGIGVFLLSSLATLLCSRPAGLVATPAIPGGAVAWAPRTMGAESGRPSHHRPGHLSPLLCSLFLQ